MDRRTSLKTIAAGGLAALAPWPLIAQGSRASSSLDPWAAMRWRRGFEGQRRADLGNGLYLNPIFAGDHPDPSLLRDGEDYYVTFSSFDAYPGLVIWHSRDLVNWRPVTAALRTPIGSVSPLDLGDPRRPDRRPMVGADRPPSPRPYRSRPRRRRGWRALPVPIGRRPG